jgi:predicted Zn-dependent protease
MTVAMTQIEVTYFDGKEPRGSRATLLLGPRVAVLIGAAVSQHYTCDALCVSAAVASAERFISLPDGGQLLAGDHPALLRLPQEDAGETIAHRLERRWPVALGALATVIVSLGLAYFYLLPQAGEWAAARIPPETEAALGAQAIDALSRSGWFQPSEVKATRQAELQDEFDTLTLDLPRRTSYRLEFRKSSFIGPNAFALPGGYIVITDEMLEAAENDDEILAVLAHEVGHQEKRHLLRELLQGSAVGLAATAITADAASLSAAVSGLPVMIAQTHYSREFEAEADAFGFELLKRHSISPDAFADLMERLSKGDDEAERSLGFISTHPVTADRIARARAAARAAP